MTITGHGRTTARLAFAAIAATVAILAVGAGSALASPATVSKATNTCWLDVVNDWLDHNGQIHGTYPIPCYTQAIQHLDSYPDIKEYSTAADDIHRALLAALRQDRGGGPGNGGLGGDNNIPPGTSGHSGGGGGSGFFGSLAKDLGPGNARSIPLPLLVLGGLALILLLAAVATWVAKRVQTRRVTPAPASAPLPRNPR
jgi:hypothetical protein